MPEKLKTLRPHAPTPKAKYTRVYQSKAWATLRRVVLQRDAWTCQACGKALYGFDATVDHIDEMQSGGSALPTIEGLQALCRSCNSTKGLGVRYGS